MRPILFPFELFPKLLLLGFGIASNQLALGLVRQLVFVRYFFRGNSARVRGSFCDDIEDKSERLFGPRGKLLWAILPETLRKHRLHFVVVLLGYAEAGVCASKFVDNGNCRCSGARLDWPQLARSGEPD